MGCARRTGRPRQSLPNLMPAYTGAGSAQAGPGAGLLGRNPAPRYRSRVGDLGPGRHRAPCALTRPRPRKQCSRRRPAPGLPVGGLARAVGGLARAVGGKRLAPGQRCRRSPGHRPQAVDQATALAPAAVSAYTGRGPAARELPAAAGGLAQRSLARESARRAAEYPRARAPALSLQRARAGPGRQHLSYSRLAVLATVAFSRRQVQTRRALPALSSQPLQQVGRRLLLHSSHLNATFLGPLLLSTFLLSINFYQESLGIKLC